MLLAFVVATAEKSICDNPPPIGVRASSASTRVPLTAPTAMTLEVVAESGARGQPPSVAGSVGGTLMS